MVLKTKFNSLFGWMNINIKPSQKILTNEQNVSILELDTKNHSIEYLYLSVLKSFLLRSSKDDRQLDDKFITPQELLDVNSLDVKIFLDTIRSEQTDLYSKNFLEMLLYPISQDVKVSSHILGDFIDPAHLDDNMGIIFGEIKDSKRCLVAFRKFTVAVERDLLKDQTIQTHLSYTEFRGRVLALPKNDVANRYKILAYFLTNVLEYLLIGPLNREKRNKLKQLIRFVNTHEVVVKREQRTSL